MESLLRWSIENSTPSSSTNDPTPPQPRTDLNPEIIDLLLGKPDSVLMKEALETAVDENKDEDIRVAALDDFEMLVEQIDNANNISKMEMWNPLQSLLLLPTSPNTIKANILWIIGTAVQNNPEAQNSYLSLPNSLSSILQHLSALGATSAVRSKAAYALSGLLKHNRTAVKMMAEFDGWEVLRVALQDPDITVRRKVVFLISSLLIPSFSHSQSRSPPINTSSQTQTQQQSQSTALSTSTSIALHPSTDPSNAPIHPNSHASMTAESTNTSDITADAIHKYGILDVVVESIVNPLPHGRDGEVEGDIDYTEKALSLLHTYLVSCAGMLLSDSGKASLREWVVKRKSEGERWDLTETEVDQLINALYG